MPAHRTPKKGKGGNRNPQLNRTFGELEERSAIDLNSSNSPPSSVLGNIDSVPSVTAADGISQEIEKKLEVMRKEFQQQMFEMQRMVMTQIQELARPTVPHVEHSNEALSGNQNRIEHEISDQNARGNESEIQPVIAQKPKKIYPLPEFSGSPEEWAIFIEDFRCTTSEFGYSNLQNIMRLREALTGRARETVEALLSNSANVDDIMETLQETFGRPEQLIKSQINKVCKMSPVVDGDLEGLVVFANKVINMAAFLKNARGTCHLANPSLLSELVSKLPIPRQVQWAEKCLTMENTPTISDFSSWINAVRKVANVVVDSLPIQKQAKAKYNNNNNNVKKVYQAIATTHKCVCCKGECRNIQECKQFLTLSSSERNDRVKMFKLCFCCLKKGHSVSRCFSKNRCNKCDQKHHPLLHEDSANNAANITHTNNFLVPENRSCHLDTSGDGVIFQVVPVILYANNRKVQTYAFVDDGANTSLIDKELASQLGIKGSEDVLDLKWFKDYTTREKSEMVQVQISGVHEGAQVFNMSGVYTSENLSLPIQSLKKYDVLRQQNSAFSQIPITYYESVQPRILISLDHAYLTTALEAPISSEGPGLVAIKTRLGWIVYGPTNNNNLSSVNPRRQSLLINKVTNDSEEVMSDMMAKYFDMETFGIKNDAKPLVSSEDEQSLKILNNTINRKNDRFECGLLWREDFSAFPQSYPLAYKRLLTVEKKMSRDPEYAQKYCEKIDDYVSKGYARKLTKEETMQTCSKTFYLPHFGVINSNKPGIRLVFDAAAKANNISFNDALLSGPDINKPLISILMKFRQAPIAVVGDIKEMFHQIQALEADQDSQRFLWRKGDTSKRADTYVMQRIIFGATCSPSIAQFVKNFNAERFRKQFPRAVHGIVDRHYVDDYVDCLKVRKKLFKSLKT